MANYIAVPLYPTGTLQLFWYQVTAIRTDPRSATRCLVTTLQTAGDPANVNLSAAALVALLATASGIVVGGQPTAPYAGFTMVGGGTIYCIGRNVSTVRSDPTNVNRSFVYTPGNDGPWNITTAPATAAALLALVDANAGGGGGGGGFAQLVVAAVFCDAAGVVLASITGGRAIVVANAAGHVADSGVFVHNLSGVDVPAAFGILPFGAGPQGGTISGAPSGPTQATIRTGSPLVGSATTTAAGVITDAARVFLTNPYVPGSGVYEYTLQNAGSFAVSPTVRGATPVGGAVLTFSVAGPGTFVVTATNDALAPIDVDHALEVYSLAPGQSLVPADVNYGFLILAGP